MLVISDPTYVPFEGRMENEVPSLPLTIFHEKSAAAFRLLLIVTTPRKPENEYIICLDPLYIHRKRHTCLASVVAKP
jgi:hypothetical protein